MPQPTKEGLRQPEQQTGMRLLTPNHLGSLFRDSYYYSQQSPWLQQQIFEFLKSQHPGEIISPETRGIVLPRAIKTIARIVLQSQGPAIHRGISSVGIGESVIDAFDRMIGCFSEERTPNMSELVEQITAGVIKSDYYYTATPARKNSGRVRIQPTNPEVYKPEFDPFLSQFCYYGLEENTTRTPEFDSMFFLMRQGVIKGGPEKISQLDSSPYHPELGEIDALVMANAVVTSYNRNHPGKNVKLPWATGDRFIRGDERIFPVQPEL